MIEVNTPFESDNQILELHTSQNLLPYTNDDLSDMGHHTTETLVPVYHTNKIDHKFDIAVKDGAPLTLE